MSKLQEEIMKMQYYLIVRGHSQDTNPALQGPYASLKRAKEAATEFEIKPEYQFLILSVDSDGGFEGFTAAVVPEIAELKWS
jgi:hypothetical protein